jgi:hypothetical protein
MSTVFDDRNREADTEAVSPVTALISIQVKCWLLFFLSEIMPGIAASSKSPER